MRIHRRPQDPADPAGDARLGLTPITAHAGRLPFRAVNQRDHPGYDPGLQRHHLLPRQLLAMPAFARLFAELGIAGLGYDDFRRNGLLLPANAAAARRLARPLHCGPHRHYNAVVIERMGGIEREWARARQRDPAGARAAAQFRIGLLQRALYRRLLAPTHGRLALNRNDPRLDPAIFADLDAMAEQLWGATAVCEAEV